MTKREREIFGIDRELVWLYPEPDSSERKPYWRYSDRYGRCWLEPAAV